MVFPVEVRRAGERNVGDFYVPYDMEKVRRGLSKKKTIIRSPWVGVPTTDRPERVQSTVRPVLRFQSSPATKPYRPWDDKSNQKYGRINQVNMIVY